MTPTTGTFISKSTERASMNFAISYGKITVIDRVGERYAGKMPIVSFAWLNANLLPRHRPIIHSKN